MIEEVKINKQANSITFTNNNISFSQFGIAKEIKRLKEDYMILQNASDEVEEEKDKEIERLNNIINEIEKDIKNLYTYGIKNNAEQKDYLLNRLEGLKEYRGSDKE